MRRYLTVFAVLLLFATACGGTGENRVLPDLELELVDGPGSYEIQQTGEPRALNLWATWCAPCRAELPAFDDVAGRVQGVEIVGINVGDNGNDAAALIDELDLSFRQVLDPNGAVQQELRITGMPATIFVDGDGAIAQIHAGELNTEELEAILVELFDATFSQ